MCFRGTTFILLPAWEQRSDRISGVNRLGYSDSANHSLQTLQGDFEFTGPCETFQPWVPLSARGELYYSSST